MVKKQWLTCLGELVCLLKQGLTNVNNSEQAKLMYHFDPRKKNFPMISNNTKSEERIGRYGL